MRSQRDLGRRLIVLSTLVLLGIAVFSIAGHWTILSVLDENVNDSRVVNIAGRQRMLSERLLRVSLALSQSQGEARALWSNQLGETLDEIRRADAGLMHRKPEMRLGGQNSAAVSELFRQLRPSAEEMFLLASEGPRAGRADFAGKLLAAQSTFVKGMNDIVFQYDQEAKERVERAKRWQLGLLSGVLVMLAATVLFVLRPATRIIRTTFEEIAHHSEQLEKTVEARTAELLQEIERHQNAAAELEKANARLERLSWEDALTGLCNRRRFDDALQREWRRAVRSQSRLSLIMFDIDHFKAYNDIYGHGQGDNALELVAQALQAAIKRPCDLLARYGGEEFAAILPGTDRRGAEHVAKEAVTNVLDLRLPHRGGVTDVVTVSAGIADALPTRDVQPTTLIAAADRELYRAKRGGRNRVSLPPPSNG